MRKTVALLLIVCVVGSRDASAQSTAAKVRPYRLAVGITPKSIFNYVIPSGSFGLSASMDLFTRSRFTLRGDAMAIDEGSSVVSADLTYNIPVGPLTAYTMVGAGWSGDVRAAFLGGGGVDFPLRGRPLFVEYRAYRQGSSNVFRAGVRF
jgi:hypothetical protein